MMETPSTMFKKYISKSKLNLSVVNLIMKKEIKNGKERLITQKFGNGISKKLY